jgi:hypothetical protein
VLLIMRGWIDVRPVAMREAPAAARHEDARTKNADGQS